jgi:hypothetical protein
MTVEQLNDHGPRCGGCRELRDLTRIAELEREIERLTEPTAQGNESTEQEQS